MRNVRILPTILTAGLAVGLAACGTGESAAPESDGETGAVNFAVSASALTATSLVTVGVNCNEASPDRTPFQHTYEMPVAGQDIEMVTARFELPLGTCDFDVKAYASADTAIDPVYQGSRTGFAVDGSVPTVVIILHEVNPSSVHFGNSAPFITSLLISSTAVGPGTDVYLEVFAEDADGDAISYLWTSDDGTFDGADTDFAVWMTSGLEGTYSLGVTVSDGQGASTSISNILIEVDPRHSTAVQSVGFQVAFNHGPSVTNIFVSQEDTFDPDFNERAFHKLTAETTDFDGDSLTHTWTAHPSCGAFLVLGTEGEPILAPSATGSEVLFDAIDTNGCDVTLTATDGSATGTGTIELRKLTRPIEEEPKIRNTFQSHTAAGGGVTINLSADILVPGVTGLPDYDWFFGTGGGSAFPVEVDHVLIDPNDPSLGSRLTATWTTPACFNVQADLVLSIESPSGDSFADHVFAVTGLDTSCP